MAADVMKLVSPGVVLAQIATAIRLIAVKI